MEARFDPILVEVIKNELAAITEEMAIAVWKTGRSAMMKTGDFATAMCDGQGRLIGQGYAAPFQLAFFIEMMPYIIKKYGTNFKPGDVIITNDPYAGITHMPDVAIIAPAFWKDQLVAFTLAYSHHTDIGGRFPGGFSSQCTETYEEGLRLPTLKLYEGGKRNGAKADDVRLAAQRSENCNRARSHAAALDSGQRIARVNEKGEREVLDDKGRADEMRRAREVIASECK